MEFMKEFEAMHAPVPDTDLERAKNYIALGFPAEFQTVGEIAGKLEEMVIYDLPDAYFSDYIGRVLAVTKADVQRVARTYLDPATMSVVLVGDRASIEKNVAAMNLGPLSRKTVEDVLGKAPVVEGSK
jgi:zinc protease